MTANHRNRPVAPVRTIASAGELGGRQRGTRMAFLVLGMAWMLAAAPYPGTCPVVAQEPNSAAVRDMARKRVVQQQVRDSAKRLVSEQLDLQMLQLRENGLDKLPLYAELEEMRANLDALVATHMQEVVALLDRLQSDDGLDERAVLALAREKSREILVQLLMERQRLLRRLKMAELESQVRRLIERQSVVRDGTLALPGLAESARPLAAVTCREDQKDVAALYAQMTALLEEVAGWDGEIGREAAGGLAFLREQESESELAAAAQSLFDANWSAAVEHQNRAIETFERLLMLLRRASGLLERNDPKQRSAVLEKLAARQEELRRRTEFEAANPESADRLVEEQLRIQKELESTRANLPDALTTPLQQAAEAAGRAAEQLFQANAVEAMRHQDEVLANIADALSRADQATPAESPHSAAQPQRDPMADLAEAAEALRQARENQHRASESARGNRISEAADWERQIARDVTSIPDGRELPEHVRFAIDEAAQQVDKAAQTLAEHGREPATHSAENAPAGVAGQRNLPEDSADGASPSSKADVDATVSAETRDPSPTDSDSAAVRATRSAEQALEKALSVVETELADLARQRAANAVVAAAREAFRSAANGAESSPWFEQARRSAQELAELTSRQLREARIAAEAVERHLNEHSVASAEAFRQWEQARSALLEAAAAQQRAAGNPKAAEAIMGAASAEEAVAQAREAARAMAADEASPNADVAATGPMPASAEASATAAPGKGGISPRKEADLRAAQAQVVEALDRARSSLPVTADPAEPATARGATERASVAARQALEQWSASPLSDVPSPVASLQRDAARDIAAAAESVQEAMQRMQEAVRQELARNRQAAQSAVEKAIPVTPRATESLHQAESAATSGLARESAPAAAAQEASRGKFLDAAAAIAARESQLRQALEAANRLPALLTPDAMAASPGNSVASDDSPSDSGIDPVTAAVQAVEQLAAGAANPSLPTDSPSWISASSDTPTGDRASRPPLGTPPAGQTANRVDGASPNAQDAGRSPASQSATAQGKTGGVPESANHVDSPTGGPIWMPNLPAEVRAAIRAASESPPPPAYRERLRNYFKNVK